MAYQNQPNRLYLTSDDAKFTSDHAGDFTIRLDEPILGAKSCNVVSCEYPTSFYNVLTTDTFTFDEVYYTTAPSNVEVKRVRFTLTGLEEDNYTATELVTALNSKLTYSSGVTSLIGKDNEPFKLLTGDETNRGLITADGTTTYDASNYQVFIKFLHTESSRFLRFSKIHFDEISEQSGHTFTHNSKRIKYGFLMEKIANKYKIVFIADLDNFKQTDGTYEVDLQALKLDVKLTTNAWYMGVILEDGLKIKKLISSSNTMNFKSVDYAQIEPIMSDLLNNPFIAHSTPVDLYSNFSPQHNNTLGEISMYAKTSHIYDYNYNYSSSLNYTKAKLVVAYNSTRKRFSIVPQKHSEFRDKNGNSVSGNTFPFFHNIYAFGQTYFDTSSSDFPYETFLEIPIVDNDITSINYMMGARSSSVDFIKTPFTGSNITLTMPHISRMIRYPYLYLLCDFVYDSSKSGNNQTNILQKLPLSSEYGNVNFFNITGSDSMLYCKVSRDNLQSLKFRLVDKANNEIDLNGGEVSFVLNFEY